MKQMRISEDNLAILLLFLYKNICCGYSLESPQQGDSNEYPQPQCANHFDHLRFSPKIATNHTVNLAKSHTDTRLRKTEK